MRAETDAGSESPYDLGLLAALADSSPAGVAVFDDRLRYAYVNPALARFNGLSAAAHLGRTVAEVLPGLDVHEDVARLVLADGVPREATSSGSTWGPSAHPHRYWHVAYHRLEAHGRRRGVMSVVMEMSDVKNAKDELERARRHLSMLDTAAVRIGTTLDMDTTCAELADFVVPELADMASVEVFPPDVGHAARQAPPGVLRLRRAAFTALPELRETASVFAHEGEYIDHAEDSLVATCLATNQPALERLGDPSRLRRAMPTEEMIAAYRAVRLHSAVAVPLAVRGGPVGTLNLVRTGDSPPFNDDDVLVARELAGRAAVDLDHARRYTHEHSIAKELQRALLSEPRGPHPHVEVATRYLPADRGAVVGGDWFDVVPLRDGRHLKVMGDVMGHGVEAAVAMSHYRSLLRMLAGDDLPPHRVLEQLDQMVERSGIDRAATCLVAVVDRFGGLCEIASAGHLPPVLIEPGAGARVVPVVPGPPLGMGFGGYRTQVVPCGPGTVLFMYTDGLVERRGEDIDVSVGRLATLTLPESGRLEDLLDEVLDRFGEGADDDIAVLASRIRESVGQIAAVREEPSATPAPAPAPPPSATPAPPPSRPVLVDGPRPARGIRRLDPGGAGAGPDPGGAGSAVRSEGDGGEDEAHPPQEPNR